MYAIHHRIALVQGPPGTGKTFVAALYVAIMALLNRGWRCAVACVTNMAVDNFLDDLWGLRLLPGSPYSTLASIGASEADI